MQTIQNDLRTYRNEIKGAAILWVVFFHAQLGLGGALYDIQKIGYGGVDVFFFLSGFGLYHSLSRDRDLEGYFRRRMQRLLPAYLPFCLVWLLVMIPMADLGLAGAIRTAAGNLLMVGFFSGAPVNLNWYVSALAASLVIAPFLYACLEKRSWRSTLALVAGSFALGLAFIDSQQYMAVSRLPVFILGMLFAQPVQQKSKDGILAAVLAASFAVGLFVLLLCFDRFESLLYTYGMYWHPFVLIAPALCAGLGWLFAHLPAKVLLPLRWLGMASFEIFLFNVWLEVLGKTYGLFHGRMAWALWSMGSIVAGVLYHLTVRLASRKGKRLFSEKS